MLDCGFPLIEYQKKDSPRKRGRSHGEAFREAIGELAHIRRGLMLEKNPSLAPRISSLASRQMQVTNTFDSSLAEELEGIAEGAGLTLEDIVILNNYTDFRDVELPDEGCSCVCLHGGGRAVSGQTWDMHQSAKHYFCLIRCPLEVGEALVLSLVGCLGLMGATTKGTLVGINNLNTKSAEAALIWPALVRRLLWEKDVASMRAILKDAPVTSGHNYMLADFESAEHWEVLPGLAQKVDNRLSDGVVFHTNHCLDSKTKALEKANALSASTHPRYEILKREVPALSGSKDLTELFKSHQGYPHSICVHPDREGEHVSATCGGGVFDHLAGTFHTWRGCPHEDQNFRAYDFCVDGEQFVLQ